MEKNLKLTVLLIIVMLAASSLQMSPARGYEDKQKSVIDLERKTPLTNEQIKATWSSLPSAKQIFENDGSLYIDLRYAGKQAQSMLDDFPDPNSPTVIDIASTIINQTTTSIDFLNGGLQVSDPKIWLQYNSTVWVQVPSKYLQTTRMTDEVQQPLVGDSTWAVGMYANPQEITGSYDVWGVCTFGQWNWATFGGGAGKYLATNVLTVCSNNYCYQEVMVLTSGGRQVMYNVWELSTYTPIASGGTGFITNAETGKLYNMYIRYTTGAGWQMWWNQTLMWTFTDSSNRVRNGAQPNTVVESNDFTSSHFSGFSTNIGGTYSGYPLCAAAYLFNGAWKPSATGDYAPAGKTYLGGNILNGIGVGTQAPPDNWGSSLNIGQTSSTRERFTIGAGLTQRTHGYSLWTYGTV